MAEEKVLEIGIKQEEGYFYFIDLEGDISRIKSDNIKEASLDDVPEPPISQCTPQQIKINKLKYREWMEPPFEESDGSNVFNVVKDYKSDNIFRRGMMVYVDAFKWAVRKIKAQIEKRKKK